MCPHSAFPLSSPNRSATSFLDGENGGGEGGLLIAYAERQGFAIAKLVLHEDRFYFDILPLVLLMYLSRPTAW